MLVMVVFFIAFRWIHLSTPLIRLFLLVLVMLVACIALGWVEQATPLLRLVLWVLIQPLTPSLTSLVAESRVGSGAPPAPCCARIRCRSFPTLDPAARLGARPRRNGSRAA